MDRFCLGQWNAWAEAGSTFEERKARLEQVPEQFRADVLAHLKTAHALRHKTRDKKRHDEILARLG